MRRYLIHLSYFGTRYRGFQKQNINGKIDYGDSYTICGLLEIALKGCGALNYPKVTGSSRTDKGVHALCNTVHVDLDGDRKEINSFSIAKAVNSFFAYNDHDIRVLKVQQVADDFHCRYNVCERKYLYRLAFPKPGIPFRERVVIPSPITEFNRCHFLQDHNFDAEAVKSACSLFLGEKDFASLCSKSKHLEEANTVRELKSLELTEGRPLLPLDRLTEEYNFWEITCRGRAFLYHQVRRIVSSLLAYGRGRVTTEDLQRLFDEPGDKSWSVIGSMVPPEGLFLAQVVYKAEDLAFSEELSQQEQKEQELKEETLQLLEKLKIPEITVLEKIEIRKRLVEIRQITFSLQKKKFGLRSTETLIKTSAGDVFLEKRNEKGDSVVEKIACGPGYIVDTKPDLQVAEVLPGLLMGSQDVAQDEDLVRAHNITHILSVGVHVSDLLGVKHTYVEALDLPEFDMRLVFNECTRIIDEERKSGGVIYIHCNAGISRSSSVVIAYLMKTEGIGYLEAYDRLKRVRPCIKPNDGFVKQLKLLDEDLF